VGFDMAIDESQIDEVIFEICKNANYARMDAGLVRKVVLQETSKRKNKKEIVKAAKSKLHQIGTVYLDSPKPLQIDCLTISSEQSQNIAYQKQWAIPYLQNHASTRERFDFVDEFYEQIIAELSGVDKIIDLACGMNPLFRPWMPISADVQYSACDIFRDGIEIINGFFSAFHYQGEARICDLTSQVPDCSGQVVFLLKTLPCLEQVEKGIGKRLLSQIKADTLVISFPSKSLGGRNVGMQQHYQAYLNESLESSSWQITTLNFFNETVYILKGGK
jgi:16S rRNA (guanine(1405)-N(7))-methyltransferase